MKHTLIPSGRKLPVLDDYNVQMRIHFHALRILGISSQVLRGSFTNTKKIADPNFTVELLNKREFSAGDTGVHYRVINHWGSLGLLDDDREKNSQNWRKFSLKQIIWMRAIQVLRECGMSLDKIQKVHATLGASSTKGLPSLDAAIGLCTRRVPVFMIAMLDGTAGLVDHNSLDTVNDWLGYHHHIRLCLNHILQEVVGNGDYRPIYPAKKPQLAAPATAAEQEVLKALRDEEVESVRVSLHEGDITYIDTTKKVEGAASLLKAIQDVGHGELSIKVQNSKATYTQIVKKRKIKS